jgi:hypothetical protein
MNFEEAKRLGNRHLTGNEKFEIHAYTGQPRVVRICDTAQGGGGCIAFNDPGYRARAAQCQTGQSRAAAGPTCPSFACRNPETTGAAIATGNAADRGSPSG